MTPARIVTQKWPADSHWEMDAVRLGADQHGVWCGITRGTVMERPGRTIVAVCDHLTLTPYDDWWLATFYGRDRTLDAGRPFDTYVDIATPGYWTTEHGVEVMRSVDLDLDVIRGTTGRVWVDDEDEFADHRVRLNYPSDVVEHAMEACTSVLGAVRTQEAPFDGVTAEEWLVRFRRHLRRPGHTD